MIVTVSIVPLVAALTGCAPNRHSGHSNQYTPSAPDDRRPIRDAFYEAQGINDHQDTPGRL